MDNLRSRRKESIRTLLKGIETGDPASVEVINPRLYIQHNPQTHEGRDGLAALFARLAKSSPRVNIVRIFSDGDFVFGHTEYDFATRRIGFEVFRFEGDQAIEHWDNIQPRRGPNASGRSMVDGPTEASDQAKTELNRDRVRDLVTSVFIGREFDRLDSFFDKGQLIQHDPELKDGVATLRAALSTPAEKGIVYEQLHRVLADGNFVLAVSEGQKHGVHTAFYDLFRIAEQAIAEHWNTIEHVAPATEWKNDNGKF